MMGAVINFPLQTYLLWLTIDNWQWADPIKISIFVQLIITVVALIRVYAIRMNLKEKILIIFSFSFLPFFFRHHSHFHSMINHILAPNIINS